MDFFVLTNVFKCINKAFEDSVSDCRVKTGSQGGGFHKHLYIPVGTIKKGGVFQKNHNSISFGLIRFLKKQSLPMNHSVSTVLRRNRTPMPEKEADQYKVGPCDLGMHLEHECIWSGECISSWTMYDHCYTSKYSAHALKQMRKLFHCISFEAKHLP